MTEEPQPMQALAKANEIRLYRAGVKRSIEAGESAASHILEPDWKLDTMPVGMLLRAQRRWGREKAKKYLAQLSVSYDRPIGRLTLRQRRAIAAGLRG